MLLALAACAAQPPVYTPVAVDMPVMVPCKMPALAPPRDFMAALPADAGLARGMKACLTQSLLDRGFIDEATAAMTACDGVK